MIEVRIHGRGGQGVVTAAELLSEAAFEEGRHAQAFPTFGSERTGAPVVAYCRIGDHPIRTREPVLHPDILVVQDATLLHQVDVFSGLGDHGFVLINSTRTADELGITELEARLGEGHLVTLPATALALEHVGKPVPNAVLLGAVAGATGLVHVDALSRAIEAKFPGAVGERNVRAACAGHHLVREASRAPAD